MKMAFTFTCLLILGIASFGVIGASNSALTSLGNFVKGQSDPDVAPQESPNSPVRLFIMLTVLNIANVDERNNFIEVEAMVRTVWHTGITWNPHDFGGTDSIVLPKKYLWTPPLQTITGADEYKDRGPSVMNILSNGTAVDFEVLRLRVLCDVEEIASGSTCHIKTALWGFSKDQVEFFKIKYNPASAVRYFQGSNYEVAKTNVKILEFPFGGKSFQVIDFSLTIHEKAKRRRHGPFRALFQWF